MSSQSVPGLAGSKGLATQSWSPLMDLLPQGVMLLDASGRVLEANRAAERLLGRGREILRSGGPWDTIAGLAPEDGAAPVSPDPGTGARRILGRTREDGVRAWFEVCSEPVPEGRLLVTLEDITAFRSQAGQLTRITEMYAALSQVNQAIVWSTTPEELFAKICEVLVEFGKFSVAWIGRNDPETHVVSVLSHYGDRAGRLQDLEVRSDDSPAGKGGAGTAIREGRTCIFNDLINTEAAAPWRQASMKAGFAASAAIPIRAFGSVWGVLWLGASEKDFFGPQEQALMEEAATDIGFALDNFELTRRKNQAEGELRHSERKLSLIFDKSPVMLVLSDAGTGEILDLNEAFEHASGFSREEILGKTSVELGWVAREARLGVRDQVADAQHMDSALMNFRSRTGETLTGICSVQAVLFGARSCFLSSIQDITGRARAEEQLRESKAKLEAALASMTDAVFISNAQGEFIEYNDAFATFHKFKDKSECATRLADYPEILDVYLASGELAPLDLWAVPRALRGETVTNAEYLLHRKDLDVRWHGSYSFGPIRDKAGAIVGSVVVGRDITEQKRAEASLANLQAQLFNAQKMDSLGNLAGGIAHDMNNVLGAILALASANLELEPKGTFAYQAFETINQAALRGGEMAKRLLTFARRSPAKEAAVDLNTIVREEIQLLERTTLARVRLEMDLEEPLGDILGDPGALAHAIMNLCVNAVDALPENGRLSLRTRRAEEGWVELRVEDAGHGMPRDVLNRALDPYFTTKPEGKGTGLGLSMAYSTVKAHGGVMEIQSEPGIGTCVKLRFPCAKPGLPRGDAGPGAGRAPGRASLKVLLVDDDELIQRSMGMLLDVMDHRTRTASGGEEALAILQGGFKPDVVILDMNMPGLGGAATLRALRERSPDLPVLLSTGRADQSALDLAAEHPRVSLLPKPFTLEDLQVGLRSLGT